MNAQLALLIFAGILLLISILGGGFEVQHLKVPKVETVPRMLSGVGGVLFLGLGLYVGSYPEPRRNVDHQSSAAPTQAPRPIQFTIYDEIDTDIGVDQSEQALIRIDGDPVGTLTVNSHFP